MSILDLKASVTEYVNGYVEKDRYFCSISRMLKECIILLSGQAVVDIYRLNRRVVTP